LEQDIFQEYGYGVEAFFTLLRTLILVIAIISAIIALPQIIGFKYLPKLNDITQSIYDSTLGNSGFSYMNKVVVPLKVNRLYIGCERTVIDDFQSPDEFDKYVGLIKPYRPDNIEESPLI
jgi:hypothetical protein